MDRGTWWATVHEVAKNWTWLSRWHPHFKLLLQEEGPLSVPKSGLLSNIRKWIVWGDTHADKARDFIGKGCPGGEQDRGTQENCSAMWLTVLGFMLMGLVSGLSLAKSLFWLRVLPGGADIAQPRWMPARRILGGGQTCGSPFDLSQILLFGGGLLVPCSETSCHKITHVNVYHGAWPGWAVCQCASPDITKSLDSEVWACPLPSIWTECHVDGFRWISYICPHIHLNCCCFSSLLVYLLLRL